MFLDGHLWRSGKPRAGTVLKPNPTQLLACRIQSGFRPAESTPASGLPNPPPGGPEIPIPPTERKKEISSCPTYQAPPKEVLQQVPNPSSLGGPEPWILEAKCPKPPNPHPRGFQRQVSPPRSKAPKGGSTKLHVRTLNSSDPVSTRACPAGPRSRPVPFVGYVSQAHLKSTCSGQSDVSVGCIRQVPIILGPSKVCTDQISYLRHVA